MEVGSTREQGLHAKDSKMQNKAKQREQRFEAREDKMNGEAKKTKLFSSSDHTERSETAPCSLSVWEMRVSACDFMNCRIL